MTKLATSWLNASIFTTCCACGERFTLLDSAACAAATICATWAVLAVPLGDATGAVADVGAAACGAAGAGTGTDAGAVWLLVEAVPAGSGALEDGVDGADDVGGAPLPWLAACAVAAKLGLPACAFPALAAAPSAGWGATGVRGRAEEGGMAEVTCRL